jgi:hypothetical protein
VILTRRQALPLAAALAGPFVMAVTCSSTLSAGEASAIITGAINIKTLVDEALPGLQPLIGAGDWANVQAADAALGGVLGQLQAAQKAGSVSSSAAMSLVQAFETSLNTIVQVASTIPLIPAPFHGYLVAASMALPAIEAILGLVITPNTALAATVAAQKVSAAAPKK